MCRADLYRTAIVPIGVAFALVLWLGNAAYLYLSVSFIQMIKALMPLSVRCDPSVRLDIDPPPWQCHRALPQLLVQQSAHLETLFPCSRSVGSCA